MVKARRVTEITMQTAEAIVIRREGLPRLMCTRCNCLTPMLSPEDAAVVLSAGIRAIYREIEAGLVHFQETSTGVVLVCLDSVRSTISLRSRNSIPNKSNKEIQS